MKGLKKLFQILILISILISLVKSSFAQWTQVGQLNGLGLAPRISVVDSNVVWAAGGYPGGPIIYRTLNGGANWTAIPTIGLPYCLFCLAAKDSLTAFVADGANDTGYGGNAKFFKTTNAGLNWILIDSTGGTLGFFNDIVFSKSAPQFGIAISDPPNGPGNPFYLYKTTNGGANWVRTSPPGVAGNFAIVYTAFAIDPQFYGFIIYNTINDRSDSYITNNGGNNWYRGGAAIPIFGAGGDLVFNDNKLNGIMFAGGSYLPNIKRTTNGGFNWTTINTMSGVSGLGSASWISGTNTVFICSELSSSNQCIIRSDDAGLTWVSQNTTLVSNILEIDYTRYNNFIVAYSVSSTEQVLKSRQSVQTIGIHQIGNTIPSSFSLSQNYPNPFNPNTVIRYSLIGNRFITLKIYDVLGNEVAILVNEKQNAGIYEVNFWGSNLSSGIYFYKLETDGYRETKKMSLIK